MDPTQGEQVEKGNGLLDKYKHMCEKWKGNIPEDWNNELSSGVRPLTDRQMKYLYTEVIRDVRFIDELGEGEFGKVYHVVARTNLNKSKQWTPKPFACKVIRHRGTNQDDIMLSLQETIVLEGLRHVNICNLVQTIFIPDTGGFPCELVCLFLEYCHGNFKELYLDAKTGVGLTDNQPYYFSEQLSKHWFGQVAKGLAYLHGKGVAHCDLKDDNILYRRGGSSDDSFVDRFLSSTFKLADFGIAQVQHTCPSVKRLQYEMTNDIRKLLFILFSTGVDRPKNMMLAHITFFEKCKSRDWRPTDPIEWRNISPKMKDLFSEMNKAPNGIPASEIVAHPWLTQSKLRRMTSTPAQGQSQQRRRANTSSPSHNIPRNRRESYHIGQGQTLKRWRGQSSRTGQGQLQKRWNEKTFRLNQPFRGS